MTANDASTLLKSWNDTAATQAIVEFVDRATREGDAGYVAPSDRVAVFDIDGTLWCEKPMPIEPGFILRRLLDDYAAAADEFLSGRHPTLDRSLRECAYLPMIDLLRYLEANGFSTYIASGGDRDFMRPVTQEIYGIPAEPHRPASERRRRQLQRRHPDAALRRRPRSAGAAAAGAPRRSRTRIRLHNWSRDVARACGCRGLDGGEHQARLGEGVRLTLVGSCRSRSPEPSKLTSDCLAQIEIIRASARSSQEQVPADVGVASAAVGA
jgi:hypothetical protein